MGAERMGRPPAREPFWGGCHSLLKWRGEGRAGKIPSWETEAP